LHSNRSAFGAGFPRQNLTKMLVERSRMRALLLTSILIVAVLAIVHETHAHAGEPTRCGFWSSIEAGLSCQ
jgi:hypothetical protein